MSDGTILIILIVLIVDFFLIRRILRKGQKTKPHNQAPQECPTEEESLPHFNLDVIDSFKSHQNPTSALDNLPVSRAYTTRMKNDGVLKDCTYIDTETTGLDPRLGHVVEVAAVKVRNNQIVGTYQQLVNPGMPIPADASRINGITDEMVKDMPNFEQIELDFLKFRGGIEIFRPLQGPSEENAGVQICSGHADKIRGR